MKLLFDQNLSFKLCALLSDLFPDSKPVRDLGLDRSDDRIVWQHAKENGFLLVSQDRILRTWPHIMVIRPK
jgi:predicted nuclease of predicted toxin-antitoxin system